MAFKFTSLVSGFLSGLFGLMFSGLVHAQAVTYPFTVISQVKEASPRVTAIVIDFGKDLPINWKLAPAFRVNAELLPVKTYAGDLIANSAAAKAPRTILRAYTSALARAGSPDQGRYVIIEMDADDANAASWYAGFNPGIRQMIPYKDNMRYEVKLLQELNFYSANLKPTQPGAEVLTVKPDAAFKAGASSIATADEFTQGLFEMPANAAIKFLAYNFYKPAQPKPGAKLPLVVFLHGSGQSHDYGHFPTQHAADVLSPLLANQGGVTWVERAREQAFVLVPQVPARDTRDAAGESGWRSADTQKLLQSLIDKTLAENPSIDTSRLYLTGLSLGALGAWHMLNNPDPAVSRKFAAAVLIAGSPRMDVLTNRPANETPAQTQARWISALQAHDYRNFSVPVWLTHANTDPVVNSLGARVPFAMITGQATLEPSGALRVADGVLKSDDGLVRQYQGKNRFNGSEVRYSEYQFNGGERFLDLGMVTRHGHFSWETTFKDQALIDWLFRQVRPSR